LRLELAPFGVKVITLMAGNVASNIGPNAPELKLPSQSLYLPIQEELLKVGEYSDMPTKKFAEEVVNEVLGGAKGLVWKGGNTMLVRVLSPWLPSFLMVSTFLED
jgi:short-subunit dehydrogenase